MNKKIKKKLAWNSFIKGSGLSRVKENCENLKQILYKRYFKYYRTPKNLIMAIRLEHLQIKKHQKLSMKYLHELEQLIIKK